MNVIRKALESLSGHWYQGSYVDPNNNENACGLGHLSRTCLEQGQTEKYPIAAELMHEVAGEQYPDRMLPYLENSFPQFNDHTDTTEAEVIAVMEKAAVRLDEMI